jgi:hypothetical protein
LPATDDGEPDWKYMEEYIREIEQQLIEEYSKATIRRQMTAYLDYIGCDAGDS